MCGPARRLEVHRRGPWAGTPMPRGRAAGTFQAGTHRLHSGLGLSGLVSKATPSVAPGPPAHLLPILGAPPPLPCTPPEPLLPGGAERAIEVTKVGTLPEFPELPPVSCIFPDCAFLGVSPSRSMPVLQSALQGLAGVPAAPGTLGLGACRSCSPRPVHTWDAQARPGAALRPVRTACCSCNTPFCRGRNGCLRSQSPTGSEFDLEPVLIS